MGSGQKEMTGYLALVPYLLVAATCFFLTSRPAVAQGSGAPGAERMAWKIICAVILLLGMLRPYQVHSAVTQLLRTSAMTSGWYAERGAQQMDLLYVAGFLMAVLALLILVETRRWLLSTRMAIFTLFYLTGLMILNILSLHGLDRALGRAVAGVGLRWLLDLAGLAALIGAACWYRRARRRSRATREPRLRIYTR
jgi:hypothetical protein